MQSDLERRLDAERKFHNQKFVDNERVNPIYDLPKPAYAFYRGEIMARVKGKRVLEYGCGEDSYATKLIEWGAAEVVSIDISDEAVEQLEEWAAEDGLSDRISCRRMNAEELEFPDNSFDMIVGRAILHHLDLKRSYNSIARVLKPDGHAIFLEPLGHNPLINAYRNRTPHLRTVDEHPLLRSDLQMVSEYFDEFDTRYFTFASIGSLIFAKVPWMFTATRQMLDAADQAMFKVAPFTTSWAWTVGMVMSKPIKK